MPCVVFAQEARAADLRNLLQQSGVPAKDAAKMLRQISALSAAMPPPSTPLKRPRLDSLDSPLWCDSQHATQPAPMAGGHGSSGSADDPFTPLRLLAGAPGDLTPSPVTASVKIKREHPGISELIETLQAQLKELSDNASLDGEIGDEDRNAA